MPLVVYDILIAELWREQVLPRILKIKQPKSAFQVRSKVVYQLKIFNVKCVPFQIYMVLFNEANLVNMFETLLYSEAACLSLEDSIIDLMDYCFRKINRFIHNLETSENEVKNVALLDENTSQELDRHNKDIDFQVSS